jgi:hypothetical protein
MAPRRTPNVTTTEEREIGVPADRKPRQPRRRPIVAPKAQGLVEIVSAPEGEEAPPIAVFSIDGEVHTMPSRVPASMALEALDMFRHQGEMAATAWMLEEVLGTESYDALKACRALTGEHLKAIMDKVTEHVMGNLEATGK